jgi:predicted acyltransferase
MNAPAPSSAIAASAADSSGVAPSSPVSPPAKSTLGRLVSLDALRGFDMMWIMGADALAHALKRTWDIAPFRLLDGQMEHKDWAGFAAYDLIFPLFVFMSGASLVFSLSKIIAQHGRGEAVKRVLVRGAILFLLGIYYSGGLSTLWPGIRVLGVLQRIALAYTGAGLLFCFLKPRALVAAAVALLVGYWALMTFIPVRDIPLERQAMIERLGVNGKPPTMEQVRAAYEATTTRVTGRFEPGLNVSNQFDFEHLPGKLYDTYWDPEGILSTFPAIASCLLGVFAGLLLRATDVAALKKVGWLAAGGVAALALGWLWHLQFPVVKKIWTSSFVLVAGGYSALLLAAFYYLIDVRQWRGWAQPFVWIGMNPITLYLMHGGIVTFGRMATKLAGGDVKRVVDAMHAGAGDALIAAVALGLVFLTAWFLYSRKIFLRV